MSRTPDRLSRQEYLARQKPKARKSKYGAIQTNYNGNRYDSKKEAAHHQQLDLLKSSDDISTRVTKVDRQIRYHLEVDGYHICDYILDFRVHFADGRVEFHDVKGMRRGAAYQTFKHKQKLMFVCHGITVLEK